MLFVPGVVGAGSYPGPGCTLHLAYGSMTIHARCLQAVRPCDKVTDGEDKFVVCCHVPPDTCHGGARCAVLPRDLHAAAAGTVWWCRDRTRAPLGLRTIVKGSPHVVTTTGMECAGFASTRQHVPLRNSLFRRAEGRQRREPRAQFGLCNSLDLCRTCTGVDCAPASLSRRLV